MVYLFLKITLAKFYFYLPVERVETEDMRLTELRLLETVPAPTIASYWQTTSVQPREFK